MADSVSPQAPDVAALVQSLGVPFERIDIDPALADTAAFCEAYEFPPEQSANTIIVATKKDPKKYAACIALATTRLDVNRRVKALVAGGRLSFANAEEMKTLTGMEVGGVTPFGLPADLPLWVDARIAKLDWIILGGGSRDWKIKISPEVFAKIGGEFVQDLAID